MKRIFLCLLALVLLTSTLLVSCGNKDDKPVASDQVSAGGTTADILGFDKQNHDRDFTILLNDKYSYTKRDFLVDDYTSNGLSKVIYERNLACEDYLGIKIRIIPEDGSYNSEIINKLYTLVSSGSCEYDMVSMGLNTGIIGGYINIYQNIMKMDYVDLEHDWWVGDMVDQTCINNQLYFLTGDACLSTYTYIGCIFANLAVAEDYRVTVDFYDMVKKGDWTIDEFLRLGKLVESDDNGDGTLDPLTETYGWCNHDIGVRLMWTSAGIEFIQRQPDGTFGLRSDLDSRILDLVDKFMTAYNDPRTATLVGNQNDKNMYEAFIDDRVFLVSTYLGQADNFKSNNMDSPFAILPMPKYDANQTDYISVNMCAYNALFFPLTIPSPELSAQVAEFMGWYGQDKVVPEYYDVALKYRQNDVEANIEMLDLIRDKLIVSPNESYGCVHSTGGASSIMYYTQLTDYTTGNKGDGSVAFYSNTSSIWKTNAPLISTAIKDYVFQYYT